MRSILFVSLLVSSFGPAFAAPVSTLPNAGSLGLSSLPITDTAVFQFGPSLIAVIRATQDVDGILPRFSVGQNGEWNVSFEVPDGKLMVITDVELEESSTPIRASFERQAGTDAEPVWSLFSVQTKPTFRGVLDATTVLSTPLVFAPGKTYRLRTNGNGVTARGYYLSN
ncbi:MAG: hypothetical protein ABJB01_08095 [Rudaea sp.]